METRVAQVAISFVKAGIASSHGVIASNIVVSVGCVVKVVLHVTWRSKFALNPRYHRVWQVCSEPESLTVFTVAEVGEVVSDTVFAVGLGIGQETQTDE